MIAIAETVKMRNWEILPNLEKKKPLM